MTTALRARIEAAARDDDARALLELAIALWIATPRIAIAEIVDGLDRALVDAESSPEAPAPAALAAATTAGALERGVLLRALAQEPLEDLPARLAAVRGWRDPRVVSALADLFRRPARRARLGEAAFAAVEALVDERGDARIASALAAAIGGGAPPFGDDAAWRARLERLRARVEARGAAAPDGDGDGELEAAVACLDAWWRARRAHEPWWFRMTPVERRFWEGLAADPHDAALRLVLADGLTEGGDARGELLVRAARGEEIAPETLEAAWLRPVARWLQPARARFAGGLVDELALRDNARPLFDHPLWSTVRVLDGAAQGFSVKHWPVGRLPSVERVSGLTPRALVELLTARPPTRVREAQVVWSGRLLPSELPAHVEGAPRLERLVVASQRVVLDPMEGMPELLAGPLAAQLRAVSIERSGDGFPGWLELLDRAGAPLEELVVQPHDAEIDSWRVGVRWTPALLTVTVRRQYAPRGERPWPAAGDLLSRMPAGRIGGAIEVRLEETPSQRDLAFAREMAPRFHRASELRLVSIDGERRWA